MRGGAQYKEGDFGGGCVEISGNKFIAKEVIYWEGWKSVEASLRQFKTTAKGSSDLTHQAGHIGLIHTKQCLLLLMPESSFLIVAGVDKNEANSDSHGHSRT